MAPTKVQCRIEDLAPQPTTVDKRTAGVSGRHRAFAARTAADATDGHQAESESSPAPAAQLMEPVPLVPADAGASPSLAPHAPVPATAEQRVPDPHDVWGHGRGVMVEEVEELELPTPSLLDDVRTTPREPQPLSPLEQPGMK